jgi:mannose-6-phosphate isomerase-like protein (cupin superfamily)
MHTFGVREVQERLAAAGGGYEVVHAAPGLEVGVYVLVAPEPDSQTPHEDDEVYLVVAGSGALDVGGAEVRLSEGDAVFVEAGVAHRFGGYETLSLLVVFTPPAAEATPLRDPTS